MAKRRTRKPVRSGQAEQKPVLRPHATPRVDPDAVTAGILKNLEARRRAPFREPLALLLAHPPTSEAAQAQGNKSPDRWAQAVMMLGRLSGYSEKVEVDAEIDVQQRVKEMSDVETRAHPYADF